MDTSKYKIINEEKYQIHYGDCETVQKLRERNNFAKAIVVGMLDILISKYKISRYYTLDRTYMFSFIQEVNLENIVFGLDASGYKITIRDTQLVEIVRDLWFNSETEYKERENLFLIQDGSERVFLYDYKDYIEILIG